MAKHNELGKQGEDAAVEFLQTKGHEILIRNYRFKKAEVDVISKDGNMIVFTEVKTRSNDAFGNPEEFVNKKKRILMKQAADEYMFQQKLDVEFRFDILSVSSENGKLKIYHIKDAFFHEEDDKYNWILPVADLQKFLLFKMFFPVSFTVVH